MSDDLPTDYDVIVVGTGMPESIVAAAVARIGQRVLHLDKEAHYGGLWASYNFESVREWIFARQRAVHQEDHVNAADVEALLKPGETFVQVPQHHAAVTNAEEILNMPEMQPTKEVRSNPHAVLESTDVISDTTVEHPLLVPPAPINSQADSGNSSLGDPLPTSSSSETGNLPAAVPSESMFASTSGTAETNLNVLHSTANEEDQEADPASVGAEVPCPTNSSITAETATSSQTSDSQTESQNVAGVCPCPNFLAGGGSETQPTSTDDILGQDAATEAPSTSASASSLDALHGSAPRPEDITDDSQEMSAGEEAPKEWSLDQFTQLARKFNLDLAPRLLFSRGPMVELLISSNIARYAEFKAVTKILTYHEGKLHRVPCSRADVFGCKEVQLVEKRMLMKFLKFCLEYHKHPEEYRGYEGKPFKEYLQSKKLTPTVQHYILHAIAMCEEDIPTLQGLKASQKFLESLGRYGNSPFLSSLFGSGELPQCFCRLCAVFGGIYHLQRGPAAIIRNGAGSCVAMVSNGRRLNFRWLVMESGYAPPAFKTSEGRERVSRAIIITDRSLYPAEKEQVMLLRLPKCSAASAVIVQELGPGMMVCPQGLFVVHMTCSSVSCKAADDLMPAVEQLFETASSKHDELVKPKALYILFFNCEDTTGQQINRNTPPGLIMVSTPGPYLDYEHAVQEAKEIFRTMYPNEEFLPRAPDPEEILIEYKNNPGEHETLTEAECEDEKKEEPADRGDFARTLDTN